MPVRAETTAVAAVARQVSAGADGFVGVIVPRDEVAVSFPAQGTLATMAVKVGQHVERDQVLAELDTDALDADIASTQAVLREARASRREARVAARQARAARERASKLAESGLVATSETEQASFALERARSALQRAEALVDQRKASLAKLRNIEKSAVLKAPLSGQVAAIGFDEGARVPPGATIVSLMSGAREVRFAIPPGRADGIRAGGKVVVRLAGGEWVATVTAVAPRVDAASQHVFAEASLTPGHAPLPPVGTRVEVVPVS